MPHDGAAARTKSHSYGDFPAPSETPGEQQAGEIRADDRPEDDSGTEHGPIDVSLFTGENGAQRSGASRPPALCIGMLLRDLRSDCLELGVRFAERRSRPETSHQTQVSGAAIGACMT